MKRSNLFHNKKIFSPSSHSPQYLLENYFVVLSQKKKHSNKKTRFSLKWKVVKNFQKTVRERNENFFSEQKKQKKRINGRFFYLIDLELFETRRPRDEKSKPREDVIIIVVLRKNRNFFLIRGVFALYMWTQDQNRGKKFNSQLHLEINFFLKNFDKFFCQKCVCTILLNKNIFQNFSKKKLITRENCKLNFFLLFWAWVTLYRAKGRPRIKKLRFFRKMTVISTCSRRIIFV